MRTPATEIERILTTSTARFETKMKGHALEHMSLMTYAYSPMYQDERLVEQVLTQWEAIKESQVIPTYIGCELLVCAHCVKADQQIQQGNPYSAWVHAMDAQIFSGIALTLNVAMHEAAHAVSQQSINAVLSRRSIKTREFALKLFDQRGYTDSKKARNELTSEILEKAKEDGWVATDRFSRTIKDWFDKHLENKSGLTSI